MQSELGQIYSLRALETDTGAITGQKQAKNGLKWPKKTFSSKLLKLFGIFFKSHSIQSELGQKYSLRALNIDSGVITGQKQAKNGLEWTKFAFSSTSSL